jgi:hypothetical protein
MLFCSSETEFQTEENQQTESFPAQNANAKCKKI